MTAPRDPERLCPKCRKPIPPGSMEGLCPACLVAMNLATETRITGDLADGPSGTKRMEAPPVLPPAPEDVAPFFPQLEILECLGRGGMGIVYKARQKALDRLVALKLLAPERENDPAFAARFRREAQALARLSHPNIVTVHDFGQAGGFYYLLMEYVDGVNLRQLLQSRKLSAEEALAIVPPLCEALQYAHDRGIVHRDIKPENLLLDREGRIKIADFGIARLIEAAASHSPESESAGRFSADAGLTAATAHGVAGTPGYMAPEQRSAPQHVDRRADIYSLGVVFYEMLTGERPGTQIEPPSRIIHIDVRLDQIVLRALEKTPELRWQTAAELRTQVETLREEPPRDLPKASPGRHGVRGALVGLLTFFVVTAAISLLALSLPRKYQAQVRLTGLTAEEVTSNEVLQRVSTDLGLAERWAARESSSTIPESEVLQRLKNGLVVQAVPGDDLLTLRVTGRKTSEVEELANQIAQSACARVAGSRVVAAANGTARLLSPNYARLAGLGILAGVLFGSCASVAYARHSRKRSAPLGPEPPMHLTTAPRLAVALVLTSLVVPLAAVAMFEMFHQVQRAEDLRAQRERSVQALQALVKTERQWAELKREQDGLKRAWPEMVRTNSPLAPTAKGRLDQISTELAQLEDQRASERREAESASVRFYSEPRPGPLLLLPALLFAIPGTILGWRHLQAIRRVDPSGRHAVTMGMSAALFWPCLLGSAAVGLAVLLPLNHGKWAMLGLVLAIMAVLAYNAVLIRRVTRWVRGFAPWEGRRHAPDRPAAVERRSPVGAILLILAVVLPLGWIAVEKGESAKRLRGWSEQMSALQREWAAVADEASEVAQRERMPHNPQQVEARLAILREKTRALEELQRADRDRSFARLIPAIVLGPLLALPGILLQRRSGEIAARRKRWAMLVFIVVALGLAGLVNVRFANSPSAPPEVPQPFLTGTADPHPDESPASGIFTFNRAGETAQIGFKLGRNEEALFHFGDEGSGWFSVGPREAGDFVTVVVPSDEVPTNSGAFETGFILRTFRSMERDTPIATVNVASSGVALAGARLVFRTNSSEQWADDKSWFTFADLVTPGDGGQPRSLPLTIRIRPHSP